MKISLSSFIKHYLSISFKEKRQNFTTTEVTDLRVLELQYIITTTKITGRKLNLTRYKMSKQEILNIVQILIYITVLYKLKCKCNIHILRTLMHNEVFAAKSMNFTLVC